MITRPVVKTETGRAPKITPGAKSINLNAATQQQLEQLPRIGPATAKAIIEYRERNGLFQSLEDLEKVKRVGPKTVELIAPFLFIESDSLKPKAPR
jgi:competence protein ComEA